MSTALQPVSQAISSLPLGRVARSQRLRSGAAMQTATGCVSAFFTLENFDRRRGVATYALRVVNRTKSALVCRTWILSGNGEAVLAYPVIFEVAPYASGETRVPVWPGDFSSFDHAVAEVVGNGVHCLVEASPPPVRRVNARLAVAAAFLTAGLLTIAAAASLSQAVPRIGALAVAPEALAGTTLRAQYAVSGVGDLAYDVTSPDGRRIAGGPLVEHSGSIFLDIPSSGTAGAYTLRLAMNGPFGNTTDTRVINSVPTGGAGAQIGAISVSPMVARPGHTITVAYSAEGDGGYVRLVGTDGTIWAQQPFSKDGETRVAVPPVAGAREMRVLLHVTKGGTVAQSMAGLLVADATPSKPQSDATNTDANGVFDVVTRTVQAGHPIVVRIVSPRNAMHIALTDATSREITGTDVDARATVVKLLAPPVTEPAHDTVVATFTDAFGEESIVQAVTILP